MNTVELIGTAYAPAANTPPGWRDERIVTTRGAAARGFLIQVVAREIQISERAGSWLRLAAEQLATLPEPRAREWADECAMLADQTRMLRAELIVVLHRLVARRNRLEPRRRIDVIAVLAQPLSAPMHELFELHEATLTSATPWAELASLCAIEELLTDIIPLAIDITRSQDGDLAEAATLFCARQDRVGALSELLDALVASDPERAADIHAARERALSCFTRVLAECSEIGQELDSWRHGFVRY